MKKSVIALGLIAAAFGSTAMAASSFEHPVNFEGDVEVICELGSGTNTGEVVFGESQTELTPEMAATININTNSTNGATIAMKADSYVPTGFVMKEGNNLDGNLQLFGYQIGDNGSWTTANTPDVEPVTVATGETINLYAGTNSHIKDTFQAGEKNIAVTFVANCN
ncbi:hypothetical protein [Vibrio harveyi]|uniref:hypothetical protein n=1 Tax=Vibrio harveyi TaxID=669 RepID=UPI0018F1B16D|nr:hypothetical protein [Vibrio harveyi]